VAARAGSAETSDDLLRPSLPEGLDVSTFHRPWRPASLAVAGFFGGVLAAGALFTLNWSRLGDPKAARRCALLTAGLVVLISAVMVALIASGTVKPDDSDVSRNIRLGLRVLAIVFGLWLARQQEPRFGMYASRGNEPAGALWPSLAVIVAAIVAEIVIAAIIGVVAASLGAPT